METLLPVDGRGTGRRSELEVVRVLAHAVVGWWLAVCVCVCGSGWVRSDTRETIRKKKTIKYQGVLNMISTK